MEKVLEDYLREKVNALSAVPYACAAVKDAGAAWLTALATEAEGSASRALIAALEANIMTPPELSSLCASDAGRAIFGAEMAAAMLAHARKLEASGAAYCDCEACTLAAAILAKKRELLAL